MIKSIISNALIGKQILKRNLSSEFNDFHKNSYYQNSIKNFLDNEDIQKINKLVEINNMNDKFFYDTPHTNKHVKYIDNSGNEVVVNKGYGTLQTLLKKDKDVDFFNSLIEKIDPMKLIHKIYEFPEVTAIKIERKRTTTIENYNEYKFNSVHVDDFARSLKMYIYLSDVSNMNGPFKIYKGTANWEKFLKIAYLIKSRKLRYFPEKLCKSIDYTLDTLIGEKGQFFIFSGNALHSASNVINDYRDTIQIYFDSKNISWYSKVA